jgi:hypothetical protein
MVEQAFRVAKDSYLYSLYFRAEEEKNKFHSLARKFFEKYGMSPSSDDYSGYYQTEDLRMQLSPEDREKYSGQLKKLVDKNNVCYFKKNSTTNKNWKNEVSSKCDMSTLDGTWFWYLPYISKGMYALWHDGKELYGYLSDERKDSIEMSEYMIPIKMSEYYAIQERLTEV